MVTSSTSEFSTVNEESRRKELESMTLQILRDECAKRHLRKSRSTFNLFNFTF